MNIRRSPISLLAAALALAAALPQGARAQAGDGFLFGPPNVVLGIHGGVGRPDGRSDLFDFVTDELTLGRDDFLSVVVGGSIAFPLTPRLAVDVTGTYIGRGTGSEFRDWVDQDDVPIEQRTLFIRVPVLARGRLYLIPPGERFGRFAWIPSPVAPYVGAGAGAVWYRFRQEGDFVDFVDLSIFRDELDSNGWGPAAQLLAGADVSVTPRILLNLEAQYLWAEAALGHDYLQYEPIDLAGFQATVGVAFRP